MTTEQAVQAIVAHYHDHAEQVRRFYETAHDQLWGMTAEVDAILDGLGVWLAFNPTLAEILIWDAFDVEGSRESSEVGDE
ncbi:MAG: hypothetical protein IT324_34185 [Anaerolineae bacterium]|nr:hypothetical protein [Anaerolineae bacterium]